MRQRVLCLLGLHSITWLEAHPMCNPHLILSLLLCLPSNISQVGEQSLTSRNLEDNTGQVMGLNPHGMGPREEVRGINQGEPGLGRSYCVLRWRLREGTCYAWGHRQRDPLSLLYLILRFSCMFLDWPVFSGSERKFKG